MCAGFGLTVLETTKIEITSLQTIWMPGSTCIFSVEVVGQVNSQTNECVYLGESVHHNADLSIQVDRRIRNAWCSFRKVYPRTVRPTGRSPRAQNPDAKSQGPGDNAVWLRHVEPGLYATLHRVHYSFLTSCIPLTNEQSHLPPDFYMYLLVVFCLPFLPPAMTDWLTGISHKLTSKYSPLFVVATQKDAVWREKGTTCTLHTKGDDNKYGT